MSEHDQSVNHDHRVLLVLFWAYVLIPLGWGVYQTFKKAMALFV